MTGMLASVTSVIEAGIALEEGVDIIDIKDPKSGVLGAQPAATVQEIVAFVDGRKPVSATVGDVEQTDPTLPRLIENMSETGVDIVKVGLFGNELTDIFLRQLTNAASRYRIVVVLFAEYHMLNVYLTDLLKAGLYGLMIDTSIKNGRSLRDHLSDNFLREFVLQIQARGMIAGLSGSLRYEDIIPLQSANADYLGFRGALCSTGDRNNKLDALLVKKIHRMLHNSQSAGYDNYNMQMTV